MASLKAWGTQPVLSDSVHTIVNNGAKSKEKALSIEGSPPSGPGALMGFSVANCCTISLEQISWSSFMSSKADGPSGSIKLELLM